MTTGKIQYLWSSTVSDTFIYGPILEILRLVCRNPDIYVLLNECRPEPSAYTDFSDGSYFKTHSSFSAKRQALQIQLCYDDFETANPLGSKCRISNL